MNQFINKLIELTQCDAVKWNKSHTGLFWLDSTDNTCYLRRSPIMYRLDFNHIVYRHYYWNLNKNLLKELWIAVGTHYKRRIDAEDREAMKEIMALECPDTRLKKKKRFISEKDIPPPYTDEAANKASKGIFEK